MSTHCTTTIIERRPGQEPRTVGTWFRHHDGYPDGHGRQLVELIAELGPLSADELATALDEEWPDHEDAPDGQPRLFRARDRRQFGDTRFHYDVTFQPGAVPCQIDCLERHYDDPQNRQDDFRATLNPEAAAQWAAQVRLLEQALLSWPAPPLAPLGTRQRLSSLAASSEPAGDEHGLDL